MNFLVVGVTQTHSSNKTAFLIIFLYLTHFGACFFFPPPQFSVLFQDIIITSFIFTEDTCFSKSCPDCPFNYFNFTWNKLIYPNSCFYWLSSQHLFQHFHLQAHFQESITLLLPSVLIPPYPVHLTPWVPVWVSSPMATQRLSQTQSLTQGRYGSVLGHKVSLETAASHSGPQRALGISWEKLFSAPFHKCREPHFSLWPVALKQILAAQNPCGPSQPAFKEKIKS